MDLSSTAFMHLHPVCLAPDASEAAISACVQASATIGAGLIQAQGAMEAAGTNLLGGALAAAAALVAAGIAYFSATRATRAAQQERQARIAAYRQHIQAVVVGLIPWVNVNRSYMEEQLEKWERLKGSYPIDARTVKIDAEIEPRNWELHALPGNEFVKSARRVHHALVELNRFGMEMNGKKVDDVSVHPLMIETEDENGQIVYDEAPAALHGARAAKEADEALLEMNQVIGNAAPLRPSALISRLRARLAETKVGRAATWLRLRLGAAPR